MTWSQSHFRLGWNGWGVTLDGESCEACNIGRLIISRCMHQRRAMLTTPITLKHGIALRMRMRKYVRWNLHVRFCIRIRTFETLNVRLIRTYVHF